MAVFPAVFKLSSIDGQNGSVITAPSGNVLGAAVTSAGDVNGDGIDDVMVLAPGASNGPAAYVIYGRDGGFGAVLDTAALTAKTGLRITAPEGFSVVGTAGDFNGDGFADVTLGSPSIDYGISGDAGLSRVMFGSSSPGASFDFADANGSNGVLFPGSDYDYSAISVTTAGDFNGDGFDDLVIAGDVSCYTGGIFVVFGKSGGFSKVMPLSTLDGKNGFAAFGEGSLDYLGRTIASAGDVNGDGFDDLIVGARDAGEEIGRDYAGKSYVIFGTDAAMPAVFDMGSLDGSNGFAMFGEKAHDKTSRVCGAGDINGDGFADIAVAGPNSVYVRFGKADGFRAVESLSGLDGKKGFTIAAAQANAVAAGDVNGDGFADLLVTARTDSANGSLSGAFYVVFGKASGFAASIDPATLDGKTGFKIEGPSADSGVGGPVSAGDFNHDGFSDILLGAPGAGTGGSAYIVYGTATAAINRAGTNGDDLLSGGDFADRLSGLGGNDWIRSGGSQDWVDGGKGADRIDGGNGNDTLLGGAGSDVIEGRFGADIIKGGGGNDRISGGYGADVMSGGASKDIFLFDSALQSTPDERDTISDFTVNPDNSTAFIDRIDLSGIDGDAGTPGRQGLSFMGLAQFTGVAQFRVAQRGDDTLLFINTSTAAGAEAVVLLKNIDATTLSAADFIL